MPDNEVNREYKATLFGLIFGEHKEYALELYNAVNKTDYTDIENLEIRILKDALYIDKKNDVGYIFHDILNLIEHQSTDNPNMPLRGLGYLADLYQEYISRTYADSAAVFSTRLLKIPTPRYLVFYNGTDGQPEYKELRLSDAYDGKGDLEVVAHVLNINIGHNKDLLEACKPLRDYSELVYRIRRNKSKGQSDKDAVYAAMESCIGDGILEDILRTERDKVANILYRGLTEAEKKKLEKMELEYAREKGLAEGRTKGLAEGRDEIVRMVDYLINQDRYDDLKLATKDESFRRKILEEMADQA